MSVGFSLLNVDFGTENLLFMQVLIKIALSWIVFSLKLSFKSLSLSHTHTLLVFVKLLPEASFCLDLHFSAVGSPRHSTQVLVILLCIGVIFTYKYIVKARGPFEQFKLICCKLSNVLIWNLSGVSFPVPGTARLPHNKQSQETIPCVLRRHLMGIFKSCKM